MLNSKFTIFFTLLGVSFLLQAQDTLQFTNFRESIRNYHPAASAARLYQQYNRAFELKAYGGIDPSLNLEYGGKNFDGINYYEGINAYLNLQTPFALSLSAGYRTADGQYLNPQRKVPNAGQPFIGLKLPLFQGLLYDDVRNELRKREYMANLYNSLQSDAINSLLMFAEMEYWDWAKDFELYQLFDSAGVFASNRLNAVIRTVSAGERAPIDTLEAGLQLRTRQFELSEADINLRNALRGLENYLWDANGNNIAIIAPISPQFNTLQRSTLSELNIDELINNLANYHPELVYLNSLIDNARADLDLKYEKFKPKIDLSAELLGNGTDVNSFNQNNNYIGLGFNYSPMLFSERGEYAEGEAKLLELELKFTNKLIELKNKVIKTKNKLDQLLAQVDFIDKVAEDYRRLLQAEYRAFDSGESSLFLVFAREISYIDSRKKAIETYYKLLQTYSELNYLLAAQLY